MIEGRPGPDDIHEPSMRTRCEGRGLTDIRLIDYHCNLLSLGEAEVRSQCKRKRPKPNTQLLRIVSDAADTAHKLRGDYPAEKQAVEHSGNLTHDFGEVSASVAAAIARLKAKEDKGE